MVPGTQEVLSKDLWATGWHWLRDPEGVVLFGVKKLGQRFQLPGFLGPCSEGLSPQLSLP